MEIMNEEKIKKRGRRPKNQKKKYVLNREQTKFFVDLSNEKESLEMIFDLLLKSNKKQLGKEITFKDLAVYAVGKLNEKDIEKLQENSLTEMEKVERALDEYNRKNKTSLTLGEFLLKKLNIN